MADPSDNPMLRYWMYEPDLGGDSDWEPTTADVLTKQNAMYSGPGGGLRSLRDAIPENADLPAPEFFMDPRSMSMGNMVRSGLGTAANWLQGTPEIGPDTIAPLGLAPMGMALTPKNAIGSAGGKLSHSLPMDEASRMNRGLELVPRNPDANYPNVFLYDIHRDGRKTDGTLIGKVDGDTADIAWMGGGAPNELGVSGLRQLREAFRRDYPNVKHFTGDRVSGARSSGDEAVKQSVTLLSKSDNPTGTAINAYEDDPENKMTKFWPW